MRINGRFLSRTSSGFSVAEFLVIIATLALLMTILLPVLGKVGEAADKGRAVSHLKQLGAAFHLFAAEHGNILPAYRPHGGSLGSDAFWASYISRYLKSPYSKLHDPGHLRLLGGKSPPSTYGMNAQLPGPFWSLNWVREPGRAMLLVTVAAHATSSKYRVPPSELKQIGFHHQGKALALYVDGHVGEVSPEEVPPWAARASNHSRHQEYNAFWAYLKAHPKGVPGPSTP